MRRPSPLTPTVPATTSLQPSNKISENSNSLSKETFAVAPTRSNTVEKLVGPIPEIQAQNPTPPKWPVSPFVFEPPKPTSVKAASKNLLQMLANGEENIQNYLRDKIYEKYLTNYISCQLLD